MSRSDVLLRHLRTCEQAQTTLDRSRSGSKKPTRSKKACNKCAKSKIKCDSQKPCQRCKEKSLRCEYTRQGYSDPYEAFQVVETATSTPMAGPSTSPQFDLDESLNVLIQTPTGTGPMDIPSDTGVTLETDMTASIDRVDELFMSGWDSLDIDMPLEELRWDHLLTSEVGLDRFIMPSNFQALEEFPVTVSSHSRSPPLGGFELHQVDHVEAKCVEIRNCLRGFQGDRSDDLLAMHITRDQLVNSIQLYGRCYQPVMPIIHLSTFDLGTTPPILLLAMMLVGSCYSDNKIPAAIILQCAIHTLMQVESSTHEKNMQTPPLEVIQAHTLLCHLLVCAKNPLAYEFASIHRARTLSMAERAGLFRPTKDINYLYLTEDTFDWNLWIKLETQRRLAHHIFVTDIGHRIFTQVSPHSSPFTFKVDTPCYQSCWAASSASECLKNLQKLPPQVSVSTAIKRIRTASPQESYIFDASDYGMHSIIVGLHCLLFHVMEESLEHENNIPEPGRWTHRDETPKLSTLLHRDLLSHDVGNIADEVVAKHGSEAMRRINGALNAWRRNWDARVVQDVYGEKNTAFSHPLNFWHLAKLFVVLHFFRHHVSEGSDDDGAAAGSNVEFLVFSLANDGTAKGRIRVQEQVVHWLSRIRQRQEVHPLPAESLLAEIINVG